MFGCCQSQNIDSPKIDSPKSPIENSKIRRSHNKNSGIFVVGNTSQNRVKHKSLSPYISFENAYVQTEKNENRLFAQKYQSRSPKNMEISSYIS